MEGYGRGPKTQIILGILNISTTVYTSSKYRFARGYCSRVGGRLGVGLLAIVVEYE